MYVYTHITFPGGSEGKESACNARDPGSIPGQEDPLEKEMAPTPVFLPGKSPGQRNSAGYNPWGCKRVIHDLATKQQQPYYVRALGRQ